MLRRVPRYLRVSLVAAVLLAVGASILQSWVAATPGAGGYVQTQWGPLGPADRNLLVAVRLAGLWEGPTGSQAEAQASRTEVRTVGSNLHAEHEELDQITRDYASQLGVQLPSRPNAQQLAWMNEISALQGTQYDQRFVQVVREAHGTVLPVLAEVQAGTRNDLVRQFAAEATVFVTRHIAYLESTGLVDYNALPEPRSPGLLSGERGGLDLVVPALILVAALLAAFALFSALRTKPKKKAGDNKHGSGRAPRPDPASLATGRAIAAIAVPEPRSAAAASRPSLAQAVVDQPMTVPPATTESPSGRWIRPVTETPQYAGQVIEGHATEIYPDVQHDVHPDVYAQLAQPVAYDHEGSPVTPAVGFPPVQPDQAPLATPVRSRRTTDTGSHRLSDTGSYRVTDTGSYRGVNGTGGHRVSDTGRHSVHR